MSVAIIGPKFYAWNRDGNPLAFGKLYTYEARTNTPKDTFQSEDGVVANTNPVILNGEGYANVYLDGSYKVVLKDADENEIWSADPVTAQGGEEWVNCQSASYVSSTSFKITGNVTDKYTVNRRIRLDNGVSSYAYSTIESSVFAAGETTITIKDPVVAVGVLLSCVSIIGEESGFNKDDVGIYTDYTYPSILDMKNNTFNIDLKVGLKLSVKNETESYEYIVTTNTSDGKRNQDLGGGFSATLTGQGVVDYGGFDSDKTGPLGIVGCAGRITNNGEGVDNAVSFVDDTQHDPINCTDINLDINTITVDHLQPNDSEVVGTCIVGPDEALAQRGIFIGGSIATEVAVITMAKRHMFKIDWAAGALDINDLIVDPFMDSTRYVSTDNTGGNGAYRIVAPRTLDGIKVINAQNRVSPDAYIAEISDTTMDIFPYKTVTLRAKYDGVNWAVTGNISGLTTALMALGFTVTNAGSIIDVNHPNTLGSFSNAILSVKGVNDYFYANIFSEASTKTQVVLVDDTGSPQVPVANDEFTIQLEDILWQYGLSVVDLGMVKLSPMLDFKDIAVNNNFWLLGNHWALK